MPFLSYAQKFKGIVDVYMRDVRRFAPLTHLSESIMEGTSELSHPEREAIALFVSSLNSCHYCVGSHKAVLKALDVDAASIDGLATASEELAVDERMRPIFAFARTLTLTPGEVGQADVQQLLDAGWSEQTVEDVVCVVSLFSLINRLVDGIGIEAGEDHFNFVGDSISKHGYGPLAKMAQQKLEKTHVS